MNLFFWLLLVIIGAMRGPKLGVADVSELGFRVWPLDLDLNMHMTNSRYMALMDLRRTDLILRAGAWREMRRQKLGVVLGGAAMRFRRPLSPFARFTLATRLLGWDDRWMYLERTFVGPQGVVSRAAMRAAFVKGNRVVPPGPVLEAAVPGLVKLEPPGWVANWAEVEQDLAG